MKALLVALAILITMGWAPLSNAQTLSERDMQKLKAWSRSLGVSAFPSVPFVGQLAVITDDSASNECDSNAGSAISLCAWDGASWISVGGGAGVTTLDGAFDGGKVINGASSFANAFRVGNTSTARYWALFDDATDGLTIDCVVSTVQGACDKGTKVSATYKYYISDASGNKLFNFEPNATAPKDQYALGAEKVRKFIYFPAGSFVGDGTNCPTTATAVTINSGPKLYTMICGSSANGDMDFDVVMPNNWDGGTLEFEPDYIQTAANTSAMNSDIKAQCRGTAETPSSTWGTAIAIDDAAVTGSNARDKTLSAAVTPAGTCAAGDHLFVRYTLDVTGTTTTEATLHFLGVGMYYYESSLSN